MNTRSARVSQQGESRRQDWIPPEGADLSLSGEHNPAGRCAWKGSACPTGSYRQHSNISRDCRKDGVCTPMPCQPASRTGSPGETNMLQNSLQTENMATDGLLDWLVANSFTITIIVLALLALLLVVVALRLFRQSRSASTGKQPPPLSHLRRNAKAAQQSGMTGWTLIDVTGQAIPLQPLALQHRARKEAIPWCWMIPPLPPAMRSSYTTRPGVA